MEEQTAKAKREVKRLNLTLDKKLYSNINGLAHFYTMDLCQYVIEVLQNHVKTHSDELREFGALRQKYPKSAKSIVKEDTN